MNECSDGQALRYLGFELMQKFNILQKFKVNVITQINKIFNDKKIKHFFQTHKLDSKSSHAKFLGGGRSRLQQI